MDSWMVVSPDCLPSPTAQDSRRRFWVELFRRAGAVEITRPIITDDIEIPEGAPASRREERVVKGYLGTLAIGVRWLERVPLESTMFPIMVEEEIYGLADLEVRWEYRLELDGQLGRSKYLHRELRVRFASEKTRQVFVDSWRAVFGAEPTLLPPQ